MRFSGRRRRIVRDGDHKKLEYKRDRGCEGRSLEGNYCREIAATVRNWSLDTHSRENGVHRPRRSSNRYLIQIGSQLRLSILIDPFESFSCIFNRSWIWIFGRQPVVYRHYHTACPLRYLCELLRVETITVRTYRYTYESKTNSQCRCCRRSNLHRGKIRKRANHLMVETLWV